MIKPIRNEADYDAALSKIEKLMDAVPGTPEYDLLEVLSLLVEKYEDDHYVFDLPSPIEAIKAVMEEENLSPTDLGKIVGGKSMASLILNKKRKLSLNMIRKLSHELKIPEKVLVQDYELD
ncbi:MAG: transcriptional regulator [Bacteroidetes bacterium]|nr:MAG: transcriptional regulator [Bacteroidota bacterium]